MGSDTEDSGADSAEIPVDERTDEPGVSRIDPNGFFRTRETGSGSEKEISGA